MGYEKTYEKQQYIQQSSKYTHLHNSECHGGMISVCGFNKII